MRTGTCWYGDEIGEADHAFYRAGYRRRRVDDDKCESVVTRALQIRFERLDLGLDEGRRGGFAFVPPVGQAALRIGIDNSDRTAAGAVGLDGDMAGERCFAGPAFLRGECENLHA